MTTHTFEPQLGIPEILVNWQPSEAPVVTCYVDWRVSGRGLHEARTVVRNELRSASALVPQRGAARESFDADEERINAYLEGEADPAAHGYVIFACDGVGLWWTVALGVPVETAVHAGERPRLVPLAEATQEAARTLVVLADTNSARLIRLDRAGGREEAGPHRVNWRSVHHSQLGGWAEANYQRSMDTVVERFAHDVAATVEDAVSSSGAAHIVLAGDSEITVPLERALPQRIAGLVEGVAHLDIRTPLDEVAERVWPEVQASAAAAREREVGRLLELAGAGRAVVEPSDVRMQLEAGRVDTIAFDPAEAEDEAAELVLRDALTHRSRVIVARGHEALAAAGGAVASLRGSS